MQRRRRREVRVRDDARELRLDLGAVALQEQIHAARYLQVAVLLGIAVEPVEVALGLNGPPAVPDLALHAVAGLAIAGAVIESITADRQQRLGERRERDVGE